MFTKCALTQTDTCLIPYNRMPIYETAGQAGWQRGKVRFRDRPSMPLCRNLNFGSSHLTLIGREPVCKMLLLSSINNLTRPMQEQPSLKQPGGVGTGEP